MTAEETEVSKITTTNNTRSNDIKKHQHQHHHHQVESNVNTNAAVDAGSGNTNGKAKANASSLLPHVGTKTTTTATIKATTTTALTNTTSTETNATVAKAAAAKQTSVVETTKPLTTTTTTSIELTENFYINTKRKSNVKIQVKLSGEGIYLRRETEQNDHVNEQFIRIGDIVGSQAGRRLKKRARGGLSSCRNPHYEEHDKTNSKNGVQQPVKDSSAYLYIYAYVKQDKENLPRNRTVRILRFRSFDRYEYNLKSAQRWHAAIRQNKGLPTMESGEQTRPLLVLLNPKSGSGKARELFQRQAAPVLKEADAHYDLQITTHANHARQLVRDRKDLLQRYSGIVVASGDGLLYEVVNGLMERADWQVLCRQLPIGIIPCGSGNGLAKSIAYIYNEPYEPKPIMHAALNCVSGKTAPMDIVRVELFDAKGKEMQMYSFLAVGWGLIADIDIESERLRSIGAQRFTLWAIHRLISLRTYRGKLYYLPWKATETKEETQQPPLKEEVETNPSQRISQQIQMRKPISSSSEKIDETSSEFHDAADDDDFFADAISLDRESNYAPRVDSWHSATSRHTAYYSLAGQSIRSRRSVTSSILNKLEAANAEFEARNTPVPLKSAIPRLNEPIPSDGDWHCEEGEYVLVNSAYTTHLATDCLFAPTAQLNDGIIHLVIVRAGVGRSQLMSFLLGLSSGTHIPTTPNKLIEVVAVRAYRIEPHLGNENANSSNGIMTVDGERVNYGPIQAEIFPGMFNLMVPNSESCNQK